MTFLRNDIHHLIEKTLEFGEKKAELLEVRYDKWSKVYIHYENGKVTKIDSRVSSGIGVTAYVNGARGYSYTSKLSIDEVQRIVTEAIKSAEKTAEIAKIKMKPKEYKPDEYTGKRPSLKKNPENTELSEKIELLKSGAESIKDEKIASVRGIYGEITGEKIFMNSEGIRREWKPIMTGIIYMVVVRENGNIGSGREGFSASEGLEIFDIKPPESIADKAYKGALENAEAKTIKSGRYPIVTDPHFAGLIAHESFGHPNEGDYVATGSSILAGMLGEKIGSEHASIFESGDPINYGFWVPYDDEGVATKKVTLLNRGVLSYHLHSRATAELMGHEPTGNARAIDYTFPPIVRMRNTYFGPGEFTKEEIFELIGKGVYAEGSGGGQTEDTGNFTFAANRAYWIENGEIAYPLKGIAVRGHILEFLKNIIGASKDLIVKTSILGGCGKGGQSPLPVGLGGSYLAVKEVIIGGGK